MSKLQKSLEDVYKDALPVYYTGNNVDAFINNIWLDECTSVGWRTVVNNSPVYAYNSEMFNAISQGVFRVEGRLTINFKATGYLEYIIQKGEKSKKDGTFVPLGRISDVDTGEDVTTDSIGGILNLGQKDFLNTAVFNARIGKVPDERMEEVRAKLRDFIWGHLKAGEEGLIQSLRDVLTGTYFDILLLIGNPNSDSYDVKNIVDVQIIDVSIEMAKGVPIQLVYTFIARDVDRPSSRPNPFEYIQGNVPTASSLSLDPNEFLEYIVALLKSYTNINVVDQHVTARTNFEEGETNNPDFQRSIFDVLFQHINKERLSTIYTISLDDGAFEPELVMPSPFHITIDSSKYILDQVNTPLSIFGIEFDPKTLNSSFPIKTTFTEVAFGGLSLEQPTPMDIKTGVYPSSADIDIRQEGRVFIEDLVRNANPPIFGEEIYTTMKDKAVEAGRDEIVTSLEDTQKLYLNPGDKDGSFYIDQSNPFSAEIEQTENYNVADLVSDLASNMYHPLQANGKVQKVTDLTDPKIMRIDTQTYDEIEYENIGSMSYFDKLKDISFDIPFATGEVKLVGGSDDPDESEGPDDTWLGIAIDPRSMRWVFNHKDDSFNGVDGGYGAGGLLTLSKDNSFSAFIPTTSMIPTAVGFARMTSNTAAEWISPDPQYMYRTSRIFPDFATLQSEEYEVTQGGTIVNKILGNTETNTSQFGGLFPKFEDTGDTGFFAFGDQYTGTAIEAGDVVTYDSLEGIANITNSNFSTTPIDQEDSHLLPNWVFTAHQDQLDLTQWPSYPNPLFQKVRFYNYNSDNSPEKCTKYHIKYKISILEEDTGNYIHVGTLGNDTRSTSTYSFAVDNHAVVDIGHFAGYDMYDPPNLPSDPLVDPIAIQVGNRFGRKRYESDTYSDILECRNEIVTKGTDSNIPYADINLSFVANHQLNDTYTFNKGYIPKVQYKWEYDATNDRTLCYYMSAELGVIGWTVWAAIEEVYHVQHLPCRSPITHVISESFNQAGANLGKATISLWWEPRLLDAAGDYFNTRKDSKSIVSIAFIDSRAPDNWRRSRVLSLSVDLVGQMVMELYKSDSNGEMTLDWSEDITGYTYTLQTNNNPHYISLVFDHEDNDEQVKLYIKTLLEEETVSSTEYFHDMPAKVASWSSAQLDNTIDNTVNNNYSYVAVQLGFMGKYTQSATLHDTYSINNPMFEGKAEDIQLSAGYISRYQYYASADERLIYSTFHFSRPPTQGEYEKYSNSFEVLQRMTNDMTSYDLGEPGAILYDVARMDLYRKGISTTIKNDDDFHRSDLYITAIKDSGIIVSLIMPPAMNASDTPGIPLMDIDTIYNDSDTRIHDIRNMMTIPQNKITMDYITDEPVINGTADAFPTVKLQINRYRSIYNNKRLGKTHDGEYIKIGYQGLELEATSELYVYNVDGFKMEQSIIPSWIGGLVYNSGDDVSDLARWLAIFSAQRPNKNYAFTIINNRQCVLIPTYLDDPIVPNGTIPTSVLQDSNITFNLLLNNHYEEKSSTFDPFDKRVPQMIGTYIPFYEEAEDGLKSINSFIVLERAYEIDQAAITTRTPVSLVPDVITEPSTWASDVTVYSDTIGEVYSFIAPFMWLLRRRLIEQTADILSWRVTRSISGTDVAFPNLSNVGFQIDTTKHIAIYENQDGVEPKDDRSYTVAGRYGSNTGKISNVKMESFFMPYINDSMHTFLYEDRRSSGESRAVNSNFYIGSVQILINTTTSTNYNLDDREVGIVIDSDQLSDSGLEDPFNIILINHSKKTAEIEQLEITTGPMYISNRTMEHVEANSFVKLHALSGTRDTTLVYAKRTFVRQELGIPSTISLLNVDRVKVGSSILPADKLHTIGDNCLLHVKGLDTDMYSFNIDQPVSAESDESTVYNTVVQKASTYHGYAFFMAAFHKIYSKNQEGIYNDTPLVSYLTTLSPISTTHELYDDAYFPATIPTDNRIFYSKIFNLNNIHTLRKIFLNRYGRIRPNITLQFVGYAYQLSSTVGPLYGNIYTNDDTSSNESAVESTTLSLFRAASNFSVGRTPPVNVTTVQENSMIYIPEVYDGTYIPVTSFYNNYDKKQTYMICSHNVEVPPIDTDISYFFVMSPGDRTKVTNNPDRAQTNYEKTSILLIEDQETKEARAVAKDIAAITMYDQHYYFIYEIDVNPIYAKLVRDYPTEVQKLNSTEQQVKRALGEIILNEIITRMDAKQPFAEAQATGYETNIFGKTKKRKADPGHRFKVTADDILEESDHSFAKEYLAPPTSRVAQDANRKRRIVRMKDKYIDSRGHMATYLSAKDEWHVTVDDMSGNDSHYVYFVVRRYPTNYVSS